MKLHLFIASALILICSGCVAYQYGEPYNNAYYPSGYNYYPYYDNYYGYRPYYYPYGSLFYPNIFLDLSYRGHGGHDGFRGHGGRGGFHGHGGRGGRR